jgi:hypothetical protein
LTDETAVFPTITRDKVYLTNTGLSRSIQLYSMQGQLKNSWSETQELDLSAYPEGVYLLQLSGDAGSKTVKVIRRN